MMPNGLRLRSTLRVAAVGGSVGLPSTLALAHTCPGGRCQGVQVNGNNSKPAKCPKNAARTHLIIPVVFRGQLHIIPMLLRDVAKHPRKRTVLGGSYELHAIV
jgi:hypothetical protein